MKNIDEETDDAFTKLEKRYLLCYVLSCSFAKLGKTLSKHYISALMKFKYCFFVLKFQ